MKVIYTLFFIVLATVAFAQDNTENTGSNGAMKDGINYGKYYSEADFLISAAKDFFAKNEYQKAISCYQIADSISGLSESCLLELMKCYYNLSDFGNCIKASTKWTSQYEVNSTTDDKRAAYVMLSNSYYFTGDYNNAITYYSLCLQVGDKDRRSKSWELFMIGKSYFEIGDMAEMKRNCLSATLNLCMFFGVTYNDIWNGEVKSEEIGVMFYHFSTMLREAPNEKVDADAAMMLAYNCGLKEAATYCENHKVSKNPYKSKELAKNKNKKSKK